MFSFWYNNKIQSFCSPQKSAGCAPANRQSGSLCTGSETSHFQIVESDKKGSWCIWWDLRGLKLKFKICRNYWITNDSAAWPVVMSRNGRNYLAQRDEPPTVTTEVFHYIKYLISGGIECSNSCIYWVLWRCPLSLCWRGETGVMPSTSLSHQRFLSLWLDVPSKSSPHATKWGPAKVLPIGPRTF